MSPEAGAAVDLFEAGRGRLEETIRTCVGARQLAAGGFDADVDVAAALDASSVVPVLRDGGVRAGVLRRAVGLRPWGWDVVPGAPLDVPTPRVVTPIIHIMSLWRFVTPRAAPPRISVCTGASPS